MCGVVWASFEPLSPCGNINQCWCNKRARSVLSQCCLWDKTKTWNCDATCESALSLCPVDHFLDVTLYAVLWQTCRWKQRKWEDIEIIYWYKIYFMNSILFCRHEPKKWVHIIVCFFILWWNFLLGISHITTCSSYQAQMKWFCFSRMTSSAFSSKNHLQRMTRKRELLATMMT